MQRKLPNTASFEESFNREVTLPTNGENDFTVWRRFKEGNETAFINIYDRYFNALVNYCGQFYLDKSHIEDVIQDFFLEIRMKRNKLGDVQNIKAYLFKSIRRKILKMKKEKMKFTPFMSDQVNLHVVSFESELIQKQVRTESHNKINMALKAIPEKQREMLFYYYYENFSYQQIKFILGYKSDKIVRNLLYKAIKSLREAYSA